MVDTREDILARLLEVIASIPELRTVYRNNVELTDDQMPSGNLLDGDEETNGENDLSKASTMPMLASMTPEIRFMGLAEQIGSILGTLRREVIRRVLTDTELNERLVRTRGFGNGTIRYLGCSTTFGWQENWYGVLQVHFMFKYALKPDEL